jgi:hypothetical protein
VNPRDVVKLVLHDGDLPAGVQNKATNRRCRLVVNVVCTFVALDGQDNVCVHEYSEVPHVIREAFHFVPQIRMRQTVRVAPAGYATDLSSRRPFATAAVRKMTVEVADSHLSRVSVEDKTYELAEALTKP